MTYNELFEQVKAIFEKADVSAINQKIAYQFNIKGEAEGAFYAEVNNGKLSIEPYEYYDRDVIFNCEGDVLLKIAKGKLDPVQAFLTGKLTLEGDIDKALLISSFTSKSKA